MLLFLGVPKLLHFSLGLAQMVDIATDQARYPTLHAVVNRFPEPTQSYNKSMFTEIIISVYSVKLKIDGLRLYAMQRA